MDPGLQGKEPRLVEGGRLDEYLGPVRVLLIHHLHVQLALLEVNVILFEVFSDDVLDFGEFLRVLRIHLNALLVQLLGRLLHEPSYALYIGLNCLVQTLFFLADLILNVYSLLSEVIVRFLYLMQHTGFQGLELCGHLFRRLHKLIMVLEPCKVYPLVELIRELSGALLEFCRVSLEVLKFRYQV